MYERYAGLIFDMDGTLLDTEPTHRKAWVEVLGRYGMHFDLQAMIALNGSATWRIAQSIIELNHADLDPHALAREKTDAVKIMLLDSVEPLPLIEVVKAWHGRRPMSVGTGSESAIAEALLAHLGEKKTETILRELKLDNHTIRSAKTLAAFSGLPLPIEEGVVRRTMSQMEDWLFDAFLIFERNLLPEKREQAEQAEKLCRRIRERGDCVRMKDMKVTGNDLMEAGVKPGKTVGETLARLFAEVLEDPQKNSREELLSIAFNG